ncbi:MULTISPECIES: hypothetical protein [Sorangium]|uniref:PE-PGRS family protein n=1 Tax=Sorangium cellulosum TaxID=56 RepID=A0A4P2R5H0_SORCE|nr:MULTISPECIES: hypothetical protein [Sorangium]AUX37263.1 uncharacterized protein SOCE836_094850 [Sorangium cellulosum]WCQ96552.1 hypothetical protein NQZ70_09339 [Sorangium sp. Soce836]
MLRLTGPALLLVVLGASSLLAGCGPQIGDACITSLDCAQQEQELFCDGTQPGGYCTVFNCKPDSCQGSSVCVAFNPVLDQACGALENVRWPRFARTFCMATCDDDDDCRSGYSCVALRDIRSAAAIPPGERNAAIVDAEPEGSKACLPDPSSPPSAPGETSGDADSGPGVCGAAPEQPAWTPYTPGAGGAGGEGGAGGSGGEGGAGGSNGEGGAGGAGGSDGEGGGAGGSGGAGGG